MYIYINTYIYPSIHLSIYLYLYLYLYIHIYISGSPEPPSERGMATLAARLRVAKSAERMATITRVLPVPGGPCIKKGFAG